MPEEYEYAVVIGGITYSFNSEDGALSDWLAHQSLGLNTQLVRRTVGPWTPYTPEDSTDE